MKKVYLNVFVFHCQVHHFLRRHELPEAVGGGDEEEVLVLRQLKLKDLRLRRHASGVGHLRSPTQRKKKKKHRLSERIRERAKLRTHLSRPSFACREKVGGSF